MYQRIEPTALSSRGTPDAVAVALFENTDKLPEAYAHLPKPLQEALGEALVRPELALGKGGITLLYPTAGKGQTKRLYVLGLGEREKVRLEHVRHAAAALAKAAASAKLDSVTLHLHGVLESALPDDAVGRALGETLSLVTFVFDTFKGARQSAKDGKGKKGKEKLGALKVAVDKPLQAAFSRGVSIGESANLARNLAATPPNVANPKFLVDHCKAMAKETGLDCKVLGVPEAKRLGMGGLLAVGAAGSTPPALICLEHRPAGTARQAPVLLVGKAVTFDTGGYSIKTGEGMMGMKYDKCGGMAVIGAMHAIARLKLPIRVVGLIPTAENMISQEAYRPNDILTFTNGVTVEITNTDAEGRLILGDALAYGCKQYKPRAVVDLATLTGGVVVALGSQCAGCFCNDDQLRDGLMAAGDFTGERLWRLPLWDEHREQLKSGHADIVNSAGREAHPIQGAAFLSHFVAKDGDFQKKQDVPWAHLDIAGVADAKSDGAIFAKGPTGYGVRLLVRALETLAAG